MGRPSPRIHDVDFPTIMPSHTGIIAHDANIKFSLGY